MSSWLNNHANYIIASFPPDLPLAFLALSMGITSCEHDTTITQQKLPESKSDCLQHGLGTSSVAQPHALGTGRHSLAFDCRPNGPRFKYHLGKVFSLPSFPREISLWLKGPGGENQHLCHFFCFLPYPLEVCLPFIQITTATDRGRLAASRWIRQ